MASRPISKDDVVTTARLYGVPPALALAIWGQESDRNDGTGKLLVSPKGAVGGFQVMPGTFKEMMPKGEINNPTDNMVAGVKYLAKGLQASGGDPRGAAQFYYHGSVLKPGQRGPTSGPRTPDTLAYSDSVVARMNNILADMGPERGGNIQAASVMPSNRPEVNTSLYGDDMDGDDTNPIEDDNDEDDTSIPIDTDSPFSRLALYGGDGQNQPTEEPIPDIAGLTRPLDTGNTDWLQSMGSSQDFELDKYVRGLVDEEFANG